jgi:hypothetical protein
MAFKSYRVGNAQIIGRRKEQGNYFASEYNKAGDLLAVLADGTIDHPNGRRAAIMAVEYYINAFSQNIYGGYANLIAPETAMMVNRQIQSVIYLGQSPRLSLTVALFSKGEMKYFNVGMNRVFHYDGYSERILDEQNGNQYSCGRRKIQSKNTIGITSFGAHAVMHPMERIRIIETKKSIFDKAEAIVEAVNKKGLEDQLNATALLIEVLR